MTKRNIHKDLTEKIEEQTITIESPTEAEETPKDSITIESPAEVKETPKGSITIGVVTNCSKLNVRKTPNVNSSVSGVINLNDEVMIIDIEKSTDEFYKVRTESGLKGFCMKKYIKIKP